MVEQEVSHAELQRDVGRLEAEVGGLKRDVAEMRADVRIIRDTLSQARGGWKTLMLVGGAASAVGAAVATVVQMVPFR